MVVQIFKQRRPRKADHHLPKIKQESMIANEWAVRLAPGLDPHKFAHRPEYGMASFKKFI
jgi:hypothetical protein